MASRDNRELLTLYHGTSRPRAELVLLYGWAYSPVYVTTDIERAWHYAQARTAWDLWEWSSAGRLDSLAPALIKLRTRKWKRDTYSSGEPDQYKVSASRRGAIYILDYKGEWPAAEYELTRLRAYGVSMSWGDDRRLTKAGRALGGDSDD